MTPDSPVFDEDDPCPSCASEPRIRGDCATCLGSGVRAYQTCPLRSVSAEIWHIIEAVRLAQAGMWPVAGGLLDQCESFIEAFRVVVAADSRAQTRAK